MANKVNEVIGSALDELEGIDNLPSGFSVGLEQMICVLPFGGSKRKPFAYIFDAFKLCEISTTADMTKYHGDWQDNMFNYSMSSYFSSLVKRKR